MRVWRWLPAIVIAAAILCGAGLGLVRRSAARPEFPQELTPPGARLVGVSRGEPDRCYAHLVATFADADRMAVEAWAARRDLPCVGAAPCTQWSTDARRSPFWARDLGEVDGLDTVTASLRGTALTVDWGDYLCSGPN